MTPTRAPHAPIDPSRPVRSTASPTPPPSNDAATCIDARPRPRADASTRADAAPTPRARRRVVDTSARDRVSASVADARERSVVARFS